MAAPLFSVLMPTHSRPDVIGAAIRSTLLQSEESFELLIVGDGCGDDTRSVVSSFEDPRIRFYDLPKGTGFGYGNRNIALREACGDLIAFAADDDILLRDHLKIMRRAFRRPNAMWAYSRPLWIWDDGVATPGFTNLNAQPHFLNFMQNGNSIPAGCVVHRADCFEKAGYWPEDAASAGDWELWRKIIGLYGRSCIVQVPQVTQLHFRAGWRPQDNWGPGEISRLRTIADQGWWPNSLRIPLDDQSSPPQIVVEAILDSGPKAFANRLNRGVSAIRDDLATRALDVGNEG